MATTTYGCWDWTVEEAGLEEVCPDELAAFFAALEVGDQTPEWFARDLQDEGFEELSPNLADFATPDAWNDYWADFAPSVEIAAYQALIWAFWKNTGIAIWLKPIASDALGVLDDKCYYWSVINTSTIYTLTPSARRLGANLGVMAWAENG